jgi:iron-sulfur cluster assembly accessory protein
MMTPTINLTESATAYIKSMIKKNNGLGFRLSIKKTGCSGYSYQPSIVEMINPHDLSVSIADGVIFFIDSKWLDLLQDIHIDYIEEDKSGLKQKRLVFRNPREAARCGCGESFHVENLEG